MIFPASQPPSGLSSFGNRMCTRSSWPAKRLVTAWIARIVSSGAARRPWLRTPRPNADNGFISTYCAPISTANAHRSANSSGLVSAFGVESNPCSRPASLNLRVVSTVVANDDRPPGTDDSPAEVQDVGMNERLPAGEREAGHARFDQPGQHQIDERVDGHVAAHGSGGHKAVGAVQVAALGDLHERLTAGSADRRAEVAAAGVRVDDQRSCHSVLLAGRRSATYARPRPGGGCGGGWRPVSLPG